MAELLTLVWIMRWHHERLEAVLRRQGARLALERARRDYAQQATGGYR